MRRAILGCMDPRLNKNDLTCTTWNRLNTVVQKQLLDSSDLKTTLDTFYHQHKRGGTNPTYSWLIGYSSMRPARPYFGSARNQLVQFAIRWVMDIPSLIACRSRDCTNERRRAPKMEQRPNRLQYVFLTSASRLQNIAKTGTFRSFVSLSKNSSVLTGGDSLMASMANNFKSSLLAMLKEFLSVLHW